MRVLTRDKIGATPFSGQSSHDVVFFLWQRVHDSARDVTSPWSIENESIRGFLRFTVASSLRVRASRLSMTG